MLPVSRPANLSSASTFTVSHQLSPVEVLRGLGSSRHSQNQKCQAMSSSGWREDLRHVMFLTFLDLLR